VLWGFKCSVSELVLGQFHLVFQEEAVGVDREGIDDEGRDEACDGVDEVVCLDVDRGAAEQHVERQQDEGQDAVARAHGQNHEYGRYAHVRAGEGGRGPFAGLLRHLHQVVEEAVGVTRCGEQGGVVVEIVAHAVEVAQGDVVKPDGGEVVLRPGHGYEYIYKVIDEERGEDDERRAVEFGIAGEEVEEHDGDNHGIVGEVAHVERLAEPHGRAQAAELECRLATEEHLFGVGEEVVEVGEEAVELIGVGIPVGEQRQLEQHAQEAGQLAGASLVEIHQQERPSGDADALAQHRKGVVHAFVENENHDGGQQVVGQADHFDGKQALACLRAF